MGDGCVPLSMILGYILIDIDIEWDGGGGVGLTKNVRNDNFLRRFFFLRSIFLSW